MFPKMNAQELHIARDMLGYYGLPGGYTPGSFTSAMIRLLEVADSFNTARILNEFGEFRTPYSIMTTYGGETLSEIVAKSSAE
jgi:hypothetical protein